MAIVKNYKIGQKTKLTIHTESVLEDKCMRAIKKLASALMSKIVQAGIECHKAVVFDVGEQSDSFSHHVLVEIYFVGVGNKDLFTISVRVM